MTTSLRLRRGTTTQHSTFTGGAGEVTVDTTKKTAVVHDGTTVGGTPLARQDGSNATGTWPIGVTGASGSAAQLTTGRTIGMTGDVTYTSGSFNGTANVTGTATLANSGVTAGSYTTANITVDAKRVTAASNGSGGVTSLNGQTGAVVDTTLYAIGSYVTGRPANNSGYGLDTTLAGTSLYAIPPNAYFINTSFRNAISNNVQSTLVNTGTWRCVGPASQSSYLDACNNPVYVGNCGLWVRIS